MNKSVLLTIFLNLTGLSFWKSTVRKVYAIASQSVEGNDDVVIIKEDEEGSAPKASPGI